MRKKLESIKNQRLLFDRECKECNQKLMCKWVDTQQCCRMITDKLRVELRKTNKRRELIAKISISMEYCYFDNTVAKTVTERGMFILQEPYIFGEPFIRMEISGECNGGTFSTEYFGWCKK